MHFVFYKDLETNKPILTCSDGKLKNAIGLSPEDLIIGKTFKYGNTTYEIELTAPDRNTSPYHMDSLLIKCKAL